MSAPSAADDTTLNRHLGPWTLTALGIGAVIGGGIFVITGTAAARFAGPAIVISFVISGIGCLFAGLCYAEFAAMYPVAGSAYSYSYAALGRSTAWFVGWNLVLEYLVSAAAVAVGWSGYFVGLLKSVGIVLAPTLTSAPLTFSATQGLVLTGALINLPAMGLIVLLSVFLITGVRETARANALMVAIKIAVVLLVIVFGASHIKVAYWHPFIPPNTGRFGNFGWSGIIAAAGLVFFAYIGFDAVSVAAQEARNPQRDLPTGILASLLICTVLYILMALVLTGLASYRTLDVADPVSFAVSRIPSLRWLSDVVEIGATVGLASVAFVGLYGQSRIFYSMARDGFLPPAFCRVHPRLHTPLIGTIMTGAIAALLAGLFPIGVLSELVSIGTLCAFSVVCIGVMLLRVREPNASRPFRTPFVWVVAPAVLLICLTMMYGLPAATWIRLGVWTAIGFAIYFGYGVLHAAQRPHWQSESAKISLGSSGAEQSLTGNSPTTQ